MHLILTTKMENNQDNEAINLAALPIVCLVDVYWRQSSAGAKTSV